MDPVKFTSDTSTIQDEGAELSHAFWARIIIVAYKSGEHLQACLDALSRQICKDFEVVVVDNDCPDDCTKNIRLYGPNYKVVRAPSNLGFAGGSNFGALGATTKWIITLNPDAWPKDTWLKELKIVAAHNSHIWSISSTLVQAKNPKKLDGFGDVLSIYGIAWRGGYGHDISEIPDEDVSVFGACGAAAAYRSDIFFGMQGFDDHYFCYLEDVDLAYRIQRAGGVCIQACKARVDHVGSGSVGKGSDFQFFQTYKNNIRLIVKNAPFMLMVFQLFLYAISQIYLLYRNRNRKGAKARLNGLFEGIKLLPSAFRGRRHAKKFANVGTIGIAQHLAWSCIGVRNQSLKFWSI